MSTTGGNHWQKQQGVALISVLLVFAVVTVVAAELFTAGFMSLRRTENQLNSSQARYFALGAEQLARQLLAEDWQQDKKTGLQADYPQETWGKGLHNFQIEDGAMQLRITDAHKKFNLNSLLAPDGSIVFRRAEQFRRLLRQLGLDGGYATALEDRLDADTLNRRGEDEEQSMQGSLMANQAMRSVSELSLLPGMTHEDYLRLDEFVTAIPPNAKININSANSIILQSLGNDINNGDANQLIQSRRVRPIIELVAFLASPEGEVFRPGQDDITIRSEYFQVDVMASYRGRVSELTTILHRNSGDGKISVLSRSFLSHLRASNKN
jgi:general secretion pathway protein K